MKLGGWGSGKDLEDEEEETMIRIYCMKKILPIIKRIHVQDMLT